MKTTWRQGGVEKVGWGILANHGGGYSYRLCRTGEQLTEECFQKTPLRSGVRCPECPCDFRLTLLIFGD